jgi:inosine-uridine nucleoside N-ribohydrolase
MSKIHLDTDIGGDMDDVCALAMLLRWPDLDLTGITTVADDQGRRAGYVHAMLRLADRTDIPVAAGADVSGGYYRFKPGYPPDEENWPEPVTPRPGPLDEALALLKSSIEQGAVIVGIGQYTNFRLLEERYPGLLARANLVLMGGYVYPAPAGYPPWGNDMDYNIQLDVHSAQVVLESAHPLLVPLTITVQTALRRTYLPRLARIGPLGALIVRQAEVCARSWQNEQNFGGTCPALPRDLINFQHDPLACAIALGWRTGVQIETIPLRIENRDGWLHEIPDPAGIPTRVVTKIDGDAFNDFWCEVLCGNIPSPLAPLP